MVEDRKFRNAKGDGGEEVVLRHGSRMRELASDEYDVVQIPTKPSKGAPNKGFDTLGGMFQNAGVDEIFVVANRKYGYARLKTTQRGTDGLPAEGHLYADNAYVVILDAKYEQRALSGRRKPEAGVNPFMENLSRYMDIDNERLYQGSGNLALEWEKPKNTGSYRNGWFMKMCAEKTETTLRRIMEPAGAMRGGSTIMFAPRTIRFVLSSSPIEGFPVLLLECRVDKLKSIVDAQKPQLRDMGENSRCYCVPLNTIWEPKQEDIARIKILGQRLIQDLKEWGEAAIYAEHTGFISATGTDARLFMLFDKGYHDILIKHSKKQSAIRR